MSFDSSYELDMLSDDEERRLDADDAIALWGGIASDYLEAAKRGDPDAVIWWCDCYSTLSEMCALFGASEDYYRREGLVKIRKSLKALPAAKIKQRWGYGWPVKLVLYVRDGGDPDFFDWPVRQQVWDFVDDGDACE